VRHQFDHDSPDEYELDLDHRPRTFGGRSGRIILLGDGTEVLTDSDDTDMFEHATEDKDTANQVKKDTPDTSDVDSTRSEREGTPGPQSASDQSNPSSHYDASHSKDTEIKGVADEDSSKPVE
jgi:protein phosphatase PTC2/3